MWLWLLHITGADDTAGTWYGFWSGFGSDLAEFGIIAVIFRHFNCHKKGCWRIGKHPHKHYKLCAKHHPAGVDL